MKDKRSFIAALILLSASLAFAQQSPAEELALALQTDAMVVEEPLGTDIDCAPYAPIFEDMDLSCFELYMPSMVMRGRFGEYVGNHETLSWASDWEVPGEMPAGLDPEDRHRQRTIAVAGGGRFVITIFDVGSSAHVVVASDAE